MLLERVEHSGRTACPDSPLREVRHHRLEIDRVEHSRDIGVDLDQFNRALLGQLAKFTAEDHVLLRRCRVNHHDIFELGS